MNHLLNFFLFILNPTLSTMKKSFFLAAAMMLFLATATRAQWAVIDPTNLAGNIINTAKSIAEASKTTQNVISTFQETRKLYEQGKQYYDALKAVNNLVKEARRVQQTLLMIGEITEVYIDGFQRMTADANFSIEELTAIGRGYSILLEESNNVLVQLKHVVNAAGLSMTDKERMDVVDKAYWEVMGYRNLVRYYTHKNIGVSCLRAQKQGETARIMELYGSTAEHYW